MRAERASIALRPPLPGPSAGPKAFSIGETGSFDALLEPGSGPLLNSHDGRVESVSAYRSRYRVPSLTQLPM